jgi:agmatinase
VLDPTTRWPNGDKPDHTGLLTYAGMPYTEDPAELAGVDVAIIGAAMDELVSETPGARNGPRAIRAAGGLPGPHLEAGIDAMAELRVVDFGDAPVIPADPVASHAAILRTVGEAVDAGTIPIVLGGDHSIAEPDIRACAERHGPLGLLHFDTHTDTATQVLGVELSHGTPMYHLVRDGHVDPRRYAQVGLRGYWPGPQEWAWQKQQGITAIPMHEVHEQGIAAALERALGVVGEGPAFLSVDVDVLDPAFAPGTGTPEPGGMTPVDLLWACRRAAERLALVGADVVEVLPSRIGSTDLTALVADRIVREMLTGIALRRRRPGGAL